MSCCSEKVGGSPVLEVKIKQLPGCDTLPGYATPGSNGKDVYATEDTFIYPDEVALLPTGFCVELPPGYAFMVLPRSSAFRQGMHVEGFIDSDYRGEVFVMVHNTTKEGFQVRKGDRIAQMVVIPSPAVRWVPVEELSETQRGAGGFGHTGR